MDLVGLIRLSQRRFIPIVTGCPSVCSAAAADAVHRLQNPSFSFSLFGLELVPLGRAHFRPRPDLARASNGCGRRGIASADARRRNHSLLRRRGLAGLAQVISRSETVFAQLRQVDDVAVRATSKNAARERETNRDGQTNHHGPEGHHT